MYKAIHQSIAYSEKLAALSDFAERVWSRGVVAADLVGRISATPVIFHAKAFPLLPCDREKIVAAFKELEAVKLCHFYEVDDKQYMVFHDHEDHNKAWKNLRNVKSSIPPPPRDLCPCLNYTKEEGIHSTVRTTVATVVATTVVPVPVPVLDPVLDPVPVSDGDRGVGKGGDDWMQRMIQICESRNVPNKPETLRKWITAMAGKLGRQRTGELIEFDKDFANTPITQSYDQHCKESNNGNRKHAPGPRATGTFSLTPGELDGRLDG